MPKKLPFLISTLMCIPTLLGTANVFATDPVGRESMRYWTAEELTTLENEVEAEKELRCAGDSACEREFYQELRMNDSIEYNILDMFSSYRIIATRINPSAETVSILYHDIDAMMREWGEVEHQPLDEFHLVWLDPTMPDPMSDFSYMNNGHPLFVDEIHEDNLSDGVHLLLTKSIANDGQAWITPNKEVEFTTDSNVLSSNTTSKMYYAALIGTWQTHNYFDYGECLASSSYRPGMDCRYVFYEDFTRGYLPFEVESEPEPEVNPSDASNPIAEINPIVESNSIAETSSTPEIESSTPEISTSIIRVPEYVYANTPVASSTSTSRTSEIVTKTTDDEAKVNTTSDLKNHSEDYVEVPLAASKQGSEFPWWLIIFAFSGVTIVIFWFMLIRNKINED